MPAPLRAAGRLKRAIGGFSRSVRRSGFTRKARSESLARPSRVCGAWCRRRRYFAGYCLPRIQAGCRRAAMRSAAISAGEVKALDDWRSGAPTRPRTDGRAGYLPHHQGHQRSRNQRAPGRAECAPCARDCEPWLRAAETGSIIASRTLITLRNDDRVREVYLGRSAAERVRI